MDKNGVQMGLDNDVLNYTLVNAQQVQLISTNHLFIVQDSITII